ncbi:MAG: Gfo/Idh/MocA family oxidoreductase [Bacteroidales bacterium]|nr:Gfo/Idh/MocA family oxidoreductase [Bacteroidales bacterium]
MISDTKISRRSFMKATAAGATALALPSCSLFKGKKDNELIQGFDDLGNGTKSDKVWVPFSDRKIKVGLAGHGLCKFGVQFGFQDHPNVEVVAVTDLIPERLKEMAEMAHCDKTYPSFEEMVKDPEIEAVYIATDAPSHFRHAMLALENGKHVACAVPAVFGSLDDAYALYEKVKQTGLKYMMFETSMFHEDLHKARILYENGILGDITYAEGEYFHYMVPPLDSFKGWRVGLPPQYYPTHANAYYIGVTNGTFTEVSCYGVKSIHPTMMGDNVYKNPFGTEIALYRTDNGGVARMGMSWDTPGLGREKDVSGLDLTRPAIPDMVIEGYHGGSHGYLMNEFVTSILEDRKPLVDVAMALNMVVPGIIAHESALKDGELLKIPQFKF